MRIERVIAVPALGSYYCEDVTRLQQNPIPLAERYHTKSESPSFKFVREPGEAVSVGIKLEDGFMAWGDCVSVAYAGKAGRDGVFRSALGLEQVSTLVRPLLVGTSLSNFRTMASQVSRTPDLHPAVRFGVSQALLAAVAHEKRRTMTEVICEEWTLPLPSAPVALHAQSGTDRYDAADKMLVRRLASLPHGLVDDIPGQLGERGEKLVEYASWLNQRANQLGEPGYRPFIHLDVHGAIGSLFQMNLDKVTDLLLALEAAADPFPLRMESIVVAPTCAGQIELTLELMARLAASGSKIEVVVDEWANTREDIEAFAKVGAGHLIQVKMPDLGGVEESVEAVLACRRRGVGAFLGGTCNETDTSARVAAHVALATRPAVVMAKPGMGVDEGIMIVANEMARTLAAINVR